MLLSAYSPKGVHLCALYKEYQSLVEGNRNAVRADIDLPTFPLRFCPVIMTTLKDTRTVCTSNWK